MPRHTLSSLTLPELPTDLPALLGWGLNRLRRRTKTNAIGSPEYEKIYFEKMCNHLYLLLTAKNYRFMPSDPTASCYCNSKLYADRKKLISSALEDVRIILKLKEGYP